MNNRNEIIAGGSSFVAFIGSLTLNDVGVIVSIFVAIVTLFGYFYFKKIEIKKIDELNFKKLEQEKKHQEEIRALTIRNNLEQAEFLRSQFKKK